MNANELADELDVGYKTIRHHLDLLVENDVLEVVGDGYGDMYFLTERMESNLDVLESIADSADFETAEPMQGDSNE